MANTPRDDDNITLTPKEARAGRRGVPVLAVLIVGMLLMAIFWLPVGWFGEATDPTAADPNTDRIGQAEQQMVDPSDLTGSTTPQTQ